MCLPRVITGSLKVCYFPFKFRCMNMVISQSPGLLFIFRFLWAHCCAYMCMCARTINSLNQRVYRSIRLRWKNIWAGSPFRAFTPDRTRPIDSVSNLWAHKWRLFICYLWPQKTNSRCSADISMRRDLTVKMLLLYRVNFQLLYIIRLTLRHDHKEYLRLITNCSLQ